MIDHIILKADIRESTTLTRTLFERGLNPASYFSLNFYEPINKLLPKYSATKVFIEGDAVILAMFEHEGMTEFGVARCCMLAREIIDIVNGYNEKSTAAGLPALELGIGICFQDSAPMYLMDGSSRIMISKALNESDRLSGCTKGARRFVGRRSVPFNVFSFQTVDDKDTGGIPEEFLECASTLAASTSMSRRSKKLRSEISLQEHVIEMPMLWGMQKVMLYSGLVPVGARSVPPHCRARRRDPPDRRDGIHGKELDFSQVLRSLHFASRVQHDRRTRRIHFGLIRRFSYSLRRYYKLPSPPPGPRFRAGA